MNRPPKLHLCFSRGHVCLRSHRNWSSKIWTVTVVGAMLALAAAIPQSVRAANEQSSAPSSTDGATANDAGGAVECLPEGGGFLRARLSGAIDSELDWHNTDTECNGATRPSGGVRIRFGHPFGNEGQKLVFVFGIPGLREGKDARDLSVNITVIREGAGEFFGTQGDDKCSIDSLRQEAIAGIPLRNRRYRVIASGFCMQPARALTGEGSILITRFDFAGRVDYSEQDRAPDDLVVANDTVRTK